MPTNLILFSKFLITIAYFLFFFCNCIYSLYSIGIISRRFARKQAGDIVHWKLGLEDRLGTRIGLLSGGQRQALTLLMATMKKPDILLLDEPTAALDPKTASKVLKITDEIVTEQQQYRALTQCD